MILITGATGNVGRELVPLLIDAKQAVRVLVRDERKVAHLGDRVQRAIGDLDRPETLTTAMQGVDRVYIVTAVTEQVLNVLGAAKSAGVRHIVKQSTIEANRSLGPGRWHREQERMIEDSGMAWTFLRPTLMMVNTVQWWATTIRSQGRVYFPGGNGKAAPVDPKDVAASASFVLTNNEHEGRVYEVTGPESLSAREMVRILSEVLGKRIQYIRVPTFLAAIAMRRFGMSKRLVKALMETFGAWQRNEYAYVTDAVEQVTGRQPRSFRNWCVEHRSLFTMC